ncbi:cAMP-binding domain of CRP or a regulatory subunit of cAMP-dependent protein kinases [Pseudomonas sp. NFACC32-1]|uniref:Crp/Fnr family transcriptional regulator n=1 Tax=unclassified Pseudomonas TaxID=196821 RepID=UPI000877353A|nr:MULTISPECIES: Crp/Fnr family transcriptional regulator [unclassified Pseudomonas]MDB6446623.1 Crp/Fnr family transcriptional regulator [Pseudomonas sp. 21TX0197]ROO42646.1 Crp/Fnr family transcriptional regulator [Pseudomonas sp. 7SR1]ROO43036.1 Crp/Fnr family transcriptional regulator [Pseudomonas sp. AF76]SCX72337.1 cAMP-binding domain of CRP or a regulatory subunit of cAMP-dependent protein kinases [Pseudomonas sp. NFACC32-1]SFW89263.1 cAMP-binding domain of CRP or a regulatory subunit o
MNSHPWHLPLMAGHWYSHLPVELQSSLLDMARERRLLPGHRLFKRGDPPCGLYAVLEGAVRVGAVNEQGKEALLSVIEAPHWFGEICLFDGQPRTHDAVCVGPCTLLHLPQAALLALLQAQPVYWRHLALLMSHKLRLTFINLEHLSLMPAPARLAHRLLLIAEGYGETDAVRQVLQLPQEQLALMVSLSRQTTNQILKDLQSQGILHLGYGEIEILDIEGLRALTRT